MSHHLPDEHLITPSMLKNCVYAASMDGAPGRFWLLMQKQDKSFLEHQDGPIGPLEWQKLFALQMVGKLNRELAHDGAWICCFTHPVYATSPENILLLARPIYERWCFQWMDKDGDVQFRVCGNDQPHEMINTGVQWYLADCETAWNTWKEAQRLHEAKPQHRYKAALGERRPSAASRVIRA